MCLVIFVRRTIGLLGVSRGGVSKTYYYRAHTPGSLLFLRGWQSCVSCPARGVLWLVSCLRGIGGKGTGGVTARSDGSTEAPRYRGSCRTITTCSRNERPSNWTGKQRAAALKYCVQQHFIGLGHRDSSQDDGNFGVFMVYERVE